MLHVLYLDLSLQGSVCGFTKIRIENKRGVIDVEDSVYGYMQKYMVEKVGRKIHSAMAKMEIIPGFYSIYSHAFLKVMRVSDAHESTQNRG